ncbi:hypothetical protein BDZ90DRAFT_259957 [Jaminaea rosea]|uniref:BHLH domain-containing protein n=1 Tax=Jaminaea rosea TaxID=1569628 RepID=A0A316UW34_9BASI|nr:hypothetical protein BDZ90DRAFT_259957 [Jaminaea rosea]PWN28133.1 hypothetical protein BDZ90DRAFT_259957 [Jaminaea rosea]
MTSATSSPHPSNANARQHSQSLSMEFEMPDFNLQQSLDDLGLFNLPPASTSTQSASLVQSMASSSHFTDGSGSGSGAGTGAPVDGHPSPAGSLSRSAPERPLSSTGSHASPGSHRQRQESAAASSTAGPSSGAHPLNTVYPAADRTNANATTQSSDEANAALQQLLSSIQTNGVDQHQQRQSTAPQLSLQDIQRLLLEKERSDQLQNLQTALLRQQLEALQRARQNPQVMQQLPQQLQGSQSSVQQLLSALQGGNGQHSQLQPGSDGMSADASQLLMNILGSDSQADVSHNIPKLLADASMLAQYGLITPPASGGLNMGASMQQRGSTTSQAPFMSPLNMPQGTQGGAGPVPLSLNASAMGADGSGALGQIRHPYTPLESPAVTPASVFSNMSLGHGGEQFFSPLTSPALVPQPNYYPPKSRKSGTTPSASPLALQGKPGPLPRKNRSTTAEARANRQRPSPLIKPTVGTTGSVKRKKDNSSKPASPATVSQPESRRASISDNGNGHSRSSSQVATFTPIMAGAAKPMDASPSEGATSTPSPIDISTAMGPPLSTAGGKPMTPGSLMGIGGSGGSSGEDSSKRSGSQSSSRFRADSRASTSSQSLSNVKPSSSSKSSKSKGKGSSSVTFAANAKGEGVTTGGDEEQDEEDEDGGANGAGDVSATSDSRRTSHKAAEQKRRDSLKYCFDELRGMLPPITLDEDAPGGSYLGPDGLTEDEDAEGFDRADVMDPEFSKTANRAISKVALLRHSNEWIVRLRGRLARRDAALGAARCEVEQLRTLLMAHGIMPPAGMGQQHHQQAQHHHQMQQALHHHHQQQQQQQHMGHFMMPGGGGAGGGGSVPGGVPAPGMDWS